MIMFLTFEIIFALFNCILCADDGASLQNRNRNVDNQSIERFSTTLKST